MGAAMDQVTKVAVATCPATAMEVSNSSLMATNKGTSITWTAATKGRQLDIMARFSHGERGLFN